MAQNRREILALRVMSMRQALDRYESMDPASVLASYPSHLQDNLSQPRHAQRLAILRARRIVRGDLFAPALDDREAFLMERGAPHISGLCVAIGTHVLWREVLRLVRREDIDALSSSLDLSARDVALRGRSRDIGVTPSSGPDGLSDLVGRVYQEGSASYAAWLATRDSSSARRLLALTPSSISNLVPRDLPEDAEMRERRRFVVDVELDAMMGFEHAREVA